MALVARVRMAQESRNRPLCAGHIVSAIPFHSCVCDAEIDVKLRLCFDKIAYGISHVISYRQT